MKNFDLAQQICKALKQAERESKNNIYILKPLTMQKIDVLRNSLNSIKMQIHFDRITNSIEITTTSYVFDSCVNKLKDAFNIVDLFVIDALKDGQVCIKMKIINAAEIIRRI